MSFVCRYNPNHKMKSSTRREIHELKCPDRIKKEKDFKLCPYNPTHLIKIESFEEHLKVCLNKPKITEKEEEELEKSKELYDIRTEQEKIKYDRLKLYKDCIQEPKMVGLNDKDMKKNKIKKEKIIKQKHRPIVEKESQDFVKMADNEDYDQDNAKNEINDFPGDEELDIENDKNKDENDKIPKVFFYRYDPNDEDKDITKFSANIIDKKEIEAILNIKL